jgi:hypothetical protein
VIHSSSLFPCSWLVWQFSEAFCHWQLFCGCVVWTWIWTGIQHDHYLQVVKTEVISLRRHKGSEPLDRYDYTAHSNQLQSTNVPVVKFHYELSPMQVQTLAMSLLDLAFQIVQIGQK